MTDGLRNFIQLLEKECPGNVVRVKAEIDPVYELTGLVLELEKMKRYPVLIFERVKGFDIPVITNVLATRERCALALETTMEKLDDTILEREKNTIKPRLVDTGPVKDVVLTGNEVDLNALPIPTHFEQDGGPYITAGVMVAKDPDTGIRDASFKRLQLKGKNRLGTSFHSRRHVWDFQRRAEARGKPLDVAIIIGGDPSLALGATWLGPMDTDDYELVSGLKGAPLEVVSCETINLTVPADAEIVIEGEILPNIREPEGSLGEYTGYASHQSTRHVVNVKAISHRDKPIFQDVTPGFSAEHKLLGTAAAEPHALEAVRRAVPTATALSYSPSAPSRYYCYISMKKISEGQPQQAILAAFAWDKFVKLAVVVDDDIDVFNEAEVLWAISTRMQADEDLFIVPRVMDSMLDPSSRNGISAKVGVDATKPLKGWIAERCTIPKNIAKRMKATLDIASPALNLINEKGVTNSSSAQIRNIKKPGGRS